MCRPMNTKGIPVSRWIDGVLEDKENIAQKDNIRGMVFCGAMHLTVRPVAAK